MRKLKLQMQVSIDGFASTGPNDEQTWVTWAWEEIRPHVLGLAHTCDTILIGRKLAMDYIPYWQETLKKPDDPMHEVAAYIVNAKKVVFSKTLQYSDPAVQEWKNTMLAQGALVEEVNQLKMLQGKDIVVYGGTSFVADLIRENLIDEYHLFVNPVVLGKGEPVFHTIEAVRQMKLEQATVYHCGIVLLRYVPR